MYWDINPNSKIPMSGPQSKINLVKIFYKILLYVIFLFDDKGTYSVYTLVGMLVCYFVLLVMRYRTNPYYIRSVNSLNAICEVTLFWSTLCVLTHVLFNDGDSDIGLVYLIIEVPFAAYSFLIILERRKFNIMKSNLKNLKKDEDIEIYFNIVREYVELRERDSYRMKLEGLLKYYSKNSNKIENERLCTELSLDIGKEEEGSNKISKWYLLLKTILQDSLEKF